MNAVHPDIRYPFMAVRRPMLIASGTLVLISLLSLAFKGLNFGLDFTGGTLVEIAFAQPIDPESVRVELAAHEYDEAVVQHFGTDRDLAIRVPTRGDGDQSEVGNEVFSIIKSTHPDATLEQSSFVGAAVGDELAEDGGLALFASLIVILIYVMFRFTRQFAVGAVLALFHDVIITLGAFSLFGWTFDLPTLAAVLAVIGYSINDTIVIADRIRENIIGLRRMDIIDVIDVSTNQTLDRTLLTSGTTMISVLALLFFGGDMVRGFSVALTIGIVVGTYSSIYVAAAIAVLLKVRREDLLPLEKEAQELEEERP
jgi:preprotein translocase subunit SecF